MPTGKGQVTMSTPFAVASLDIAKNNTTTLSSKNHRPCVDGNYPSLGYPIRKPKDAGPFSIMSWLLLTAEAACVPWPDQ